MRRALGEDSMSELCARVYGRVRRRGYVSALVSSGPLGFASAGGPRRPSPHEHPYRFLLPLLRRFEEQCCQRWQG